MAASVDVLMSLAVEDPRGTYPPLPFNQFWVRRIHGRKSAFFQIRLHPVLLEVGQQPINRVGGKSPAGP